MNRALRDVETHTLIIVESGSSAYRLDELIVMYADDISLIELYRPQFEEHGLNLRIFLDEGILDFRIGWSAWKTLRAGEIFRDIATVFKEPLRQKTFIVEGKKRLELPKDDESIVMAILDLEGDYCYCQKDVRAMIPKLPLLKLV